ncbi:MAG: STAS domain-containing protein [Anaerolineales bacterium]|nr:STAS domain-containing protein [Anaerolineales bacterium]
MEIKVSTESGKVPVTVIHVDGNIDSATYQAFQSKAEELISNGAHHILINLANAPFISSAGLRAMHSIFNQLRSLHKDADDDALRKSMSAGAYKSPYLKVASLSEEAKEVFELGGFDTYIEVYDDVNKAIASF